ncbi:hypothetical protein XNC1_3312 [Xenorhabdus nematophila ATCC 19061]|uniref:Uncharacterized protein n=1 Tax=Xenorhabdus nematophila (strain ATCC 19061 / DSM 3370 / CCUG 14189 / LMG 1036 / NCIMB 9965 / AN6) TaxID=406817 RepID=D3VLN8_XENNA|nr:hypothetical protein XNC1_3312 [Xenorhabdus nematophila ATCC 19061]
MTEVEGGTVSLSWDIFYIASLLHFRLCADFISALSFHAVTISSMVILNDTECQQYIPFVFQIAILLTAI